MRKIFFTLVAIAFLATQADAQDFNFGVKGGLNLANLNGKVDNNKMLTSFHIGVLAEYMVNDQFAIQPELLFSGQGAKIKGEDGKIQLNYINIPVMLKYYVAEGLSLQAGPQIGFLVDSKLKEDKISVDGKNYFKTLDFSIGMGAGYKFNNFFVEGRYNIGLSNIMDTGSDDVENNADAKNGIFQISVGYMF